MLFSTYILSLFGYPFIKLSKEKINSLLRKCALLGIESNGYISTKEMFSSFTLKKVSSSLLEDNSLNQNSYINAFVCNNITEQQKIVLKTQKYANFTVEQKDESYFIVPKTLKVANYLSSYSKGNWASLGFANDNLLSLELTSNLKHLSCYTTMFHELLFARGDTYSDTLNYFLTLVNSNCIPKNDFFFTSSSGMWQVKNVNYSNINTDNVFILSNILDISFTADAFNVIKIIENIFDISAISSSSTEICFVSNVQIPDLNMSLFATSFLFKYLLTSDVLNESDIVYNHADLFNSQAQPTFINVDMDKVGQVMGSKLNFSKMISRIWEYGIFYELSVKGANASNKITMRFPEYKKITCEEQAIEEVVRLSFNMMFKQEYDIEQKNNNIDCSINYSFNDAIAFFKGVGFYAIKRLPFTNSGEVELINPMSASSAFLRSTMINDLLSEYLKTKRDKIMQIGTLFKTGDRSYSFNSLSLLEVIKEGNFSTFLDNLLAFILSSMSVRHKSIMTNLNVQTKVNDSFSHTTISLGFLEIFNICTFLCDGELFRVLSINLSFLRKMNHFFFFDLNYPIINFSSFTDENFLCVGEEDFFKSFLKILSEEGNKMLIDSFWDNKTSMFKFTIRSYKNE